LTFDRALGEAWIDSTLDKFDKSTDSYEELIPMKNAQDLRNSSLIRTKLNAPIIGTDIVTRPHLIELLQRGLNRKLTLISASAGYGKTTLVVMWLRTCSTSSAWLSLDEHDQDLILFVHYLIAAVRTVYPNACRDTLKLLRTPQTPPVEHLAITLVNDIAALPEPFILVLDDYHTIENEAILRLMDRLVFYLPAEMHLVLCCRTDPVLPLSSLRGRREITEIRVNDLRFSIQETQLFFEQAIGSPIDPETVNLLEQRTEGWVTGLRLAALSMRGRKDFRGFFEGFHGNTNLMLVDYLGEEVLKEQPLAFQHFLMRTSILERKMDDLSSPDIVSTDKAIDDVPIFSSKEILLNLVRSGLFITTLDEVGGWYRYHPLFRDLLRQHFRERFNAAEQNETCRRASGWYAERGHVQEALRYALAGGHTAGAIRLVEAHRLDAINNAEWHALDRWLNMLPAEEVWERPLLLIVRGLILRTNISSRSAALRPLTEAERLLLSDQTLSDIERRELLAEIYAIRISILYLAGEEEQAIELIVYAQDHLTPAHTYFRGLIIAFKNIALQASGRTDEAINNLRAAISDILEPFPYRVQAYIGLCFVTLTAGYIHQMQKAAMQFLKLSTRYLTSFILVHMAMVCLVRAYLAQEELERAQEAVDRFRNYVIEMGSVDFLMEVDILQSHILYLQGDVKSALHRAASVQHALVHSGFFLYEDRNLMGIYLRLTQEQKADWKSVCENLQDYLQLARQKHATLRCINILAHLTLAYHKQGLQDQAHKYLKEALSLAHPSSLIRTFVDLGPQMAASLKQILGMEALDQNIAEYVSLILNEFPAPPGGFDPSRDTRQRALAVMVDPLTERESEVLVLLAQELSYREIAAQLVVTINTVKKHASNTYSKLGVNNRASAVEKARKLQILPYS
jgi:LuxR family maltose regulon positive regulatory protein